MFVQKEREKNIENKKEKHDDHAVSPARPFLVLSVWMEGVSEKVTPGELGLGSSTLKTMPEPRRGFGLGRGGALDSCDPDDTVIASDPSVDVSLRGGLRRRFVGKSCGGLGGNT